MDNDKKLNAVYAPPTNAAIGGEAARVQKLVTTVGQAEELIKLDREHRSLAADQALLLRMVTPALRVSLSQLAEGIFRWNHHQGFWTDENGREISKGEKLALMHSELSEALEGIRKSIPTGEKGCEEEELADLFIRLLDYCGKFDIDLGYWLERKQLQNLQRPYRHGKKF